MIHKDVFLTTFILRECRRIISKSEGLAFGFKVVVSEDVSDNNGGSDIQIMRVAVYEEEWVSPINIPDNRERVQILELAGSWKVFVVCGTPIYGEETMIEERNGGTPYVYLCMETMKKICLPDNPVCFGEEEVLDMADITVLWLPGGITSYADMNKDGILCIGVGFYSDEGIIFVMERDYGLDEKLKEVKTKSEVKRRWSDPLPV